MDPLYRLRAAGALQQVCPQVGQMLIQPGLHPSLIHSVNARCPSAARHQNDPGRFGKPFPIGNEPKKTIEPPVRIGLGPCSCLPSFICWMSCAMVRLPVAVLVLAFRQSMSMSWPGCVLSMAPCEPPTGRSAFECHRHTSPAASSAFRPGSRVGEGDISALGCESTGSCSSTFQC